jgi:hypothetical protein
MVSLPLLFLSTFPVSPSTFLELSPCSLRTIYANGNKIKKVPENLCLLPELMVRVCGSNQYCSFDYVLFCHAKFSFLASSLLPSSFFLNTANAPIGSIYDTPTMNTSIHQSMNSFIRPAGSEPVEQRAVRAPRFVGQHLG